MSIPIPSCLVFKAALGDEDAWQIYVKYMKINLSCGHYSTFGCRCDPPCPKPSQEQIEAFDARCEQEFTRPEVKEEIALLRDNHEKIIKHFARESEEKGDITARSFEYHGDDKNVIETKCGRLEKP